MPGFDLQPTLIGPRVTIRPIAQEDWQEMFAAASDPEIWTLHPANDRYKEDVFRKYFDGAIASGSGFSFVERESGKIIGSSRYHAYNPALSEIEIGWTFLARNYWGGSYNREIKRLMLEHAFKFVDTVVFWVGQTNWRSRAAMEKIGGVLRPGIHTRGGESTPHVVFEIRKPDFESSVFWKGV
jgi:N-acetyltransferase